MLKLGSTGPQVAELQRGLKTLGYYSGAVDGIFGPVTKQAVINFQRDFGLIVDGIVGPQTAQALQKALSAKPVSTQIPSSILKLGSTGSDVVLLQTKLSQLGFNPGPIDGIFGYKTQAAVMKFQASRGLVVDGIVGPRTWSALFSVPSSSTLPSSGDKPHPLLRKRVCIDPGHGGFDPGAVGPTGLKEKDVTLDIALRLRALLEAAGFDVVMTRTEDRAPGGANEVRADLRNRVAIVNNSRADIFVSIHINSGGVASGCECYVYQRGGAAEKLAVAIQKNIVAETGLADRGVKTANFYVLRETKMPAVLGETGFISNPVEEQKLNDPQFLLKIARGYAKGICQYFGLPFRE